MLLQDTSNTRKYTSKYAHLTSVKQKYKKGMSALTNIKKCSGAS